MRACMCLLVLNNPVKLSGFLFTETDLCACKTICVVLDNTAHWLGSKHFVNVPSQHDLCSYSAMHLFACSQQHPKHYVGNKEIAEFFTKTLSWILYKVQGNFFS